MAVDVAVPAAPHARAAAVAVPASTTALVPACAVCCAAAYAGAPSLLAYCATLGVSLACLARAAWPDRVDAVLGPLGAGARRAALLARADLGADLRLLRAHPATAPVCAGAEECARRARDTVARRADGARRWAEARWGRHRDAAGAAWFVLRLAGRLIRLAATVLLDAVREEARTQAPSVLGYLRGVIRAIRPPASCKNNGKEEEAAGFAFRDIVSLVGIGFYLLFSTQLMFRFSTIDGTQFYAACLAAACGLAMLVADWIDVPDDDDGEAGTTSDTADDADDNTTQQEGAAGGEARLDAEVEVRGSWQFLWVLIIVAFCFDAFFLHVTLGPRPVVLALLALCNFEVLSVGRQVELTPDDGEGANKGAAQSVGGAVDKWRRGAMAVLAASGVKVFVIYLVLDFYLAALSFLWLCVMADLLLLEEDSLLEMDESGDDGDREAEIADEARAEHSSKSSSEDEEEANASSSEDEEEGCALKEHCDSSEEREQRREEPDDGSSRGSTDEDDSWDLVEIDPEMPAKDNCGANRKSSRLLFPWKSAA